MIQDFEKLALKYDHHIKFILLVWHKNDSTIGMVHNLGFFNKTPVPGLRIMKFGEYLHVLEKRKKIGKTENNQTFEYKKGRKAEKKKEKKEPDTPYNHPAHKASNRRTFKYQSDDLTYKGMELFINDFFENKTRHYLKAEHLPHNNKKLHVKQLNSYNYLAFLEEAKKDKKIAVIWICRKAGNKYPEMIKQLNHLGKHGIIKSKIKFASIDLSKNEHPIFFRGIKKVNKLYIYKNEGNVKNYWKITPFDDLERLFMYFMKLIDELGKSKMVEEDL